jgi:hypothetical protein
VRWRRAATSDPALDPARRPVIASGEDLAPRPERDASYPLDVTPVRSGCAYPPRQLRANREQLPSDSGGMLPAPGPVQGAVAMRCVLTTLDASAIVPDQAEGNR